MSRPTPQTPAVGSRDVEFVDPRHSRQPAPRERVDAARNRARVLEAADAVFRRSDPDTVTMGDIAHAAGVGRATLYRRYPDVRSIAVALLDQHEYELQEQLLRGEPPLGPGAPPAERLAAFYRAMVDLLERFGHLLRSAESGSARFATGAYAFWAAHVRALLVDAGVSEPDQLVDVALAPLAAELYHQQRHERQLTPDEIAGRLAWLATRITAADDV